MKLIKIVLIIFLLTIPSLSFAWKWYDLWPENISWNVSSWNKICPNWKVLLDKDDNKSQPRNWTVSCFRKDNTAPTITPTWFQDNVWVNTNVTVNVKVSDSQSWLWAIYYYVNFVKYNADSDFNINLTEEWYYFIQIYAYDKATINWDTWWAATANLASKEIIVKIDKTKPGIVVDEINDWINLKPKINYKVNDFYQWKDIRFKTFTCNWKPNYSNYLPPVVNWSITWSCNAWIKDCSKDANYEPNTSKCNWSCDDWYVKSADGKSCMAEAISLSCNSYTGTTLPTNVYYYSKDNSLISEWASTWKVFWSLPTWVSFEWDFTSNYNVVSWNYVPSLDNCSYSCNDWYHLETNNAWKCVNDTSVVCCSKPPLWYIADTNFTDCTLATNQNTPQCQYNNLCSWYVKDVLWIWNWTTKKWSYTDQTLTKFSNVSNACWYSNLPNSDWFVCDKRYYLIWSETNSTLKCEVVPVWEWSSDWVDWNKKFPCTNKPNNADYTSNWDNNNCSWTCKNWYEKNWNSCKSYDWDTSGWSSCSESCWWWTKSRSVFCTNSKWQIVNDNNCIWNKPTDTSSCNTQSCPVNWNCSFLPWICSSWNVFWDNWVSCGIRTWSCLWQFWWNDDSCSKDLWNCNSSSWWNN